MLKPWIEAMRLRTLPVSVAGVITAAGYAIHAGCFLWTPALLCLLFAILCQIASNFANEYYDFKAGRDRAGREGPRRGVTEGDITPQGMKRAIFGTLAAAAITGLSLTYWGGLWLIIAGIAIFAGALAYSTGPWPLSTHCLGEVAVIIFFGIVPVNFTYYIMAAEWDTDVFLGSIAIGLMGANVLIVNNYRDVADDRAVGKHTLATVAPRLMPPLYYLNAAVAMVCVLPVWKSLGNGWIAAPAAYLVIAAVIATAMSRTSGRALTKFLGMTAVSMMLYAIVFIIA